VRSVWWYLDLMKSTMQALKRHQAALRACRKCPDMIPPVVVGQTVL